MNRRELLFALAASACSSARGADGPRRKVTRTPTLPSYSRHYFTSTLGPSPLSVHGEVLVHRTASGKLWWWDTFVMELVGETTVPNAAAATFLADGTLAVFAESGVSCGIHCIAPDHKHRSYVLPTCLLAPDRVHLMRAPSNDSIYVVDDDELTLLRFSGTSLEKAARVPFPSVSDPARGQAFSLDDGRVVTRGDGLAVLAPGMTTQNYRTDRYIRHLARATDERLWYTYAEDQWGIHRLVLAAIATPANEIVALDFAPARIVHLASHADTIALVLVTKDARWFVAVIDDTGRERWRVELPAKQTRGFELAAVAAIAMTKYRVILRGLDEGLLVWDASNGGSIPV